MRIKLVTVILLLTCLLAAVSVADSRFQSVSGEFAQKWIKNDTVQNPVPITKSEGNGSDLWNWGRAPLGSKIVDGNLVTDPYYLRPLWDLSSNWLDETYTDPGTGLPMQTYTDPLTGKKIYRFLNPTTSKPFFTYSTYPDIKTGNLVYAYIDPMTGKEVYASFAPIDLINVLAGRLSGQTVYNQNEPWARL